MEGWDDEDKKGELDHELDEDEEEEDVEEYEIGRGGFTSTFARLAVQSSSSSSQSPASLLSAASSSSASSSSSSSRVPFTAAHQMLAMPSFLSSAALAARGRGGHRDEEEGEGEEEDGGTAADDVEDEDGPCSPALHLHPVGGGPLQSNINFFNLDQLLHLPSLHPRPAAALRPASSSSSSTASTSVPSASSSSSSTTTTTSASAASSAVGSEASGRSSLFVAAFYGNDREVMAMMEAGADPNETDKHGWTPLALAASRGYKKIAWVLLNWNKAKGGDLANPNVRDNEGCTALHRAVTSQNEDIVKLLLSAGADVNASDDNGETALHLAAERENVYLIPLLLDAGANIEAKDKDQRTAMHFAAIAGMDEACHTLIRRGADPHAQDVDRETPLHAACEHSQNEVARALVLGYQVAVNVHSRQRKTPLHLAAARNNYELCELLLQSGANVDVRMRNGRTPLHYAAAKGFVSIVALLLRHGASRDIRDGRGKGKTAREWAEIKGHPDVVFLFDGGIAKDGSEDYASEDEEDDIAGMKRTTPDEQRAQVTAAVSSANARSEGVKLTEQPAHSLGDEDNNCNDWRFWRLPVDSIGEDGEL